ncbi:MAG: hypothetical protein IJI67_02120 [Clostridia bacterium]|nr:hypothetical protein [Clostridia bacterium]
MEKKENEQNENLVQTPETAPKSGQKKQKILIIVLIVAIVLAIGCLVTALVLKRHNAGAATTTGASVTAESGEATTVADEDAAGIEYVKEPYKSDYRKIASTGIKGEPDAKIKANFYNKTRDASPELQLKNFDLLKVYEGFRIYDTTGTTDAAGTKSYLLIVYAESGKAIMVNYEEYNSTDERAKLLTEYIEELDKNYERHAKYAKSLEGEHILYE